ncbi:MAG: hypothetical protein U5K51_02645 [Flavobacteriaceae bacterium]|nr:hypothetical protein [Flavobacteriaceae bacterium]
MNLRSNCCIAIGLFLWSFSYGQMDRYAYKMELQGIDASWHRVVLPDGLFGKVSADLQDIRIYGINPAGG